MNAQNISVVTMTWARDGQEERLLRESLQRLAEANLPVFVTDGGSGEEFLRFLHSFPTFRVFRAERAGVFPQIRRSLHEAEKTDARLFLYTEPDKKLFFDGKIQQLIAAASGGETNAVLLAARSEESFATFPAFQQYTETVINHLCAEITGAPGDYTYGPFLFRRELAGCLHRLQDDIGWGWRPYLFGAAHRLGHGVRHWVEDLPCPPEQREDNPRERIYRMRQLGQSVHGLVFSTSVPPAKDGE